MRSSGNEVDNMKVSLEMDNRSFEEGAKKSLSTLERLQKALEFKGVKATALDSVSKSADLGKAGISNLTGAVTGLSGALDTIKDVAGFTMITNAANSAYQAVEQLVKGVTVDQIGAGFEKYKNITESMQTIMSATSDAYSSQEEQLEAVTRQMDKLNWFADETAFSLEDMSSSIGKFTANKVDLETAVTAIQGIGTWASKSGASVSDAGRAMYNLSQAIAVGSVKLIDWKSIENANMATSQFKQTAIDTAEALGTLTKVEEGLWKTSAGNEVSATNFNEALKDEWFTSEVLLQSLDKYGNFSVKLNDYAEEFNDDFGAANIMDLIDAFKAGEMTQKDWAAAADESGVKMERLKEIIADLSQEQYEFGMSAFRAAQETKTWEEAVDYTKEAVSTGWMNTFEILFGQYTEAKKLWSDVSEFFYDIFVTGGEKRNELLEEAFETTDAVTSKQWRAMQNRGVLNPVFLDAIKKVGEESGIAAKDLDNLDQAVRDGLITSGMLEEAYAKMMAPPGTAANETAEQIKNISEENEAVKEFIATLENYDKDAIDKITFGDHKYTEGYEDLEKGLDKVIESLGLTQDEGEQVIEAFKSMGYFGGQSEDALAGYTDEQLKALGMTKKQIREFKKLRDEGGDLSALFEELGIDTTTAGEHWTQGLHNVMDAISAFKELVENVWGEFFPSLEASSIAGWLKSFDEGSASILEYVKAAGEAKDGTNTLRNILNSFASVIDLVVGHLKYVGEALAFKALTIGVGKLRAFVSLFTRLSGALIGGASVFNLLKGFVEGLNLDYTKLANGVANLTSKFAAWFKAANPIGKLMEFLSNTGRKVGESVRAFVDSLIAMPTVVSGVEKLQRGFKLFTSQFTDHLKTGQRKLEEFRDKLSFLTELKSSGAREFFLTKFLEEGKGDLIDWIKSFSGLRTIMAGFSDIWSGIKDKLRDAGVPIDAIEEKIVRVWSILKNVFSIVVSNVRLVLDAMAFGKILSVIGAIGSAIGTVVKYVGTFAKSLGIWMLAASAFNLIKGFVSGLGIDFGAVAKGALKLADGISKVVAKFVAWFKAANPINKVLDLFQSKGKAAGKAVRAWFDSFVAMPQVQAGLKKLEGGFKIFTEGFSGHMKEGKEKFNSFMQEVDNMGGFKFSNLGKIAKLGGSMFLDWVKTFPGVKAVLDGIKDVWSGLREKLIAAGFPIEKIEANFINMRDTIKNLTEKTKELWHSFLNLPAVQSAITRFGGAFKTVSQSFMPFVKGLPDAWQNFLDKVNNLGGFKLKNIGKIFKAFKEEFLSYLGSWDGFKAIKDAFTGFFSDIFSGEGAGGGFFSTIIAQVKDAFETLKQIFESVELPSSLEDIPRFLSDLVNAILGYDGTDASGFKTAINPILEAIQWVLEKVMVVVEFARSHLKLFIGIAIVAFIFKKLSGIFKDIHEYFKAMTKELKARAFMETAVGVVLLAAAIWIVAQTFKDLIQTFGQGSFADNMLHIIPGLIAIVAVVAAMAILFKTVGKMDVKPGTAWGVAAAVAALWLVSHAFIDFSEHLSTGKGFIADMKKIIPAIIAMVAIVGAMAALFFVVGKMKVQPGTTWGIAAAVASLWVVAQAFKELSELSWESIKRGIKALGSVILGLIAVMAVASFAKVQTGTMVAIAAVIIALAGALVALSVVAAVNPKGMDKAMKALLIIMIGLAAILAIAGILKPSMGVMIALAVTIGVVGGIIILLNKFVGIDNTIKIAEGLAKLFGALGILVLAVSVLGKMPVSGIVKGVIGMVAIIAALTAVIGAIGYLVSEFDLGGYIESGVDTVSKVLGSVLGALTDILTKVKESLFGDKTPLQALTDDVAYFVQTIASPEFASNIAKIGELKLLGMAGVNGALITIFTSVIGKEAGVMALFNAVSMWATDRTAIQQLADDISYFVSTIANQTFIDNINRIGEMKLLGMSGVNGALVAIFTAIFGVEGAIMKIFNTIMQCVTGSDETAIEGLANDIKTLADTIGGEEFANDMKRLGELKLLGSAGINGALVAIFTSIFGTEGVILKIFNAILEFATGDKDFNAIRYVVNDIKYLADTLGSEEFEENIKRIGGIDYLEGAITAAVWEGVAAIFGTGGALLKIAESIIQYATGDKDFSAVRYAVNDVKYLADTLGSEEFEANITRLGELDTLDAVLNATAVGGLTALFGAGGAIGSIVDSIVEFVKGDKDYNAVRIAINNVKYLADQLGSEEFSESMTNLGAVTVPTTQISDLVSALGEIELSELVTAVQELIKGWLTGDQQSAVETWAGDVKTLAGAIKTWNAEMEAAGDLYVDTEGINSLTTAVDSVGKTGGLFGAISTFVTGAKDLGQFKTDAEELGKGIKAFIDGLGDSTNMSKIRSARDITRDIASISASASQLMDGTFWVDNMGEQLIHVATNINVFAESITDPEKLTSIGPAVGNITSAIFSFSQMKFDGDIMDESLVKRFQDDIQKIIDTITKTADVDVSGISRIKGAVEEANSIDLTKIDPNRNTSPSKGESAKMAKDNGAAVGESTVEGIKESSGAATEAASGLLNSMVTALSNMSGFIEAGTNMANAVAAGLRTGFDAVRSEAAALGSTASSNIMAAGVLSDLWAAGHNFVQGFADGIALYTYIASQAATRMANSAKDSANRALDSHSPSREMMKVGGYFGEGFEIGIVNSIAGVASAAEHMGEMAMSGLRATVSGINEILSANIDSEPVIRPVLDMSEIQNGASNLSSMFTAMNIVDPFGSFDVIGNAVDARRAATSLDDVVMALGSVEKSTSNIRGGDTFNVNGITYDDGSNIADAIRILTHAVVSERRR